MIWSNSLVTFLFSMVPFEEHLILFWSREHKSAENFNQKIFGKYLHFVRSLTHCRLFKTCSKRWETLSRKSIERPFASKTEVNFTDHGNHFKCANNHYGRDLPAQERGEEKETFSSLNFLHYFKFKFIWDTPPVSIFSTCVQGYQGYSSTSSICQTFHEAFDFWL